MIKRPVTLMVIYSPATPTCCACEVHDPLFHWQDALTLPRHTVCFRWPPRQPAPALLTWMPPYASGQSLCRRPHSPRGWQTNCPHLKADKKTTLSDRHEESKETVISKVKHEQELSNLYSTSVRTLLSLVAHCDSLAISVCCREHMSEHVDT